MSTRNYAIFFTTDADRARLTLRYLRAPSDPGARSDRINAFLRPRYPGHLIHEVREIVNITGIHAAIADQMIYGHNELHSLTGPERLRRMKRKVDGVVEEMQIRAGPDKINLGTMIHGSKLITYRVIFKREPTRSHATDTEPNTQAELVTKQELESHGTINK